MEIPAICIPLALELDFLIKKKKKPNNGLFSLNKRTIE